MKKDLKPIGIYLLIYIGAQLLIGFILGMIYPGNYMEILEKWTVPMTFISYLIVAVIFLIIYHKKLSEKLKELTLKKVIYVILAAIVLIAINELVSNIFINMGVEMENQESVIKAFQENKLLMTFAVVFFAPFIEEMVFRYSFSTFIKNKYLYIIISSLVFGLLHGVGVVTILYVMLGVLLALIYLKTNKNVLASTIAHILNNAFAVITLFIIFK